MIKIDFALAISILLSLPLVIVFIQWVFYNYGKTDNVTYHFKYVQQCPFCTYIFYDFESKQFQMCPRCHSLITQD